MYRGVRWNLEEIEDAYELISYSWTINYDTALWFDQTGSKEKSVVFKYTIEKDSVLSYFTRRKESEIVLNFEDIDIDEVEIIFPDDL